MTLEKAIEILHASAYGGITTHDQDFKEAQKLGAAAIQRICLARLHNDQRRFVPLPGED